MKICCDEKWFNKYLKKYCKLVDKYYKNGACDIEYYYNDIYVELKSGVMSFYVIPNE